MTRKSIHAALTATTMLIFASTAFAQLPSASTRALGMGDNATAAAAGFNAVAWNPALLGLPNNPKGSFTLLPLRGIAGLGPVELGDIADYSGEFVPNSVREKWLTQIEQEGSEQGTGGADVTILGLQIGRIGLQVGSRARAVSNLSPGAAELLFFGNAGRTGEPRAFNLAGARLQGHGESTAALSFGIPISKSGTRSVAVGITAKYTIGHGIIVAQDQGSTVSAEPALSLNFPVILPNTDDFDAQAGNGFGLDIGFAMSQGKTTIGASVKNIVNSFKWDETKLVFRPGTATFNATTKTSDFDEAPLSAAPPALRQLLDDAKYKPTIAVGLAREITGKLAVSADARMRAGDTTIEEEPKLHIGAGAEFKPAGLLSLRGGAAIVTGGYQIGGGVGLSLGPINLAASVASRKGELGTDVITMVTLVSTTGR
jgi:hypothetical protein